MPEIISKHPDLVTQLSAREVCRDRTPVDRGAAASEQLATFALAIAVLFAVLVALRLWRSPEPRP